MKQAVGNGHPLPHAIQRLLHGLYQLLFTK